MTIKTRCLKAGFPQVWQASVAGVVVYSGTKKSARQKAREALLRQERAA